MTAAKLQEMVDAQDFRGIVSVHIDPEICNSRDVVLAKVVAYINLEEYQNGYELIQSSKAQELDFEAAYCLYRMNKLKESLKLLQDTMDSYRLNKGLNHQMLQLKAQCYRLEEFDSALQIYSSFEQNEDTDTNIVAVEAAKLACTGNSSFQCSKSKSYSLLFNLACFQIAEDRFDLANETLNDARGNNMCNTALCEQEMRTDGYELSEIEKELIILDSQRAYVLQKLGSYHEALAIYNELLKKELDPVLRAIATNNSLAISGSNEIIKVSKALRLINNPSIIGKLNSCQTFFVDYNAIVYSLLVKKNAVAIRKLKILKSKTLSEDGKHDRLLYVELGIIKAMGKSNLVAFKEVEHFATANPNSLAAKLFLVDFLIRSRKYAEVESMLKTLLDDSKFSAFHPGLVSLYVLVLDKNMKKNEALNISRQLSGKNEHEIKQVAHFKLALGCFSEALADFAKIESRISSPHDIASHLLCLSYVDPIDSANLLENIKRYYPQLELRANMDILPAKLTNTAVGKKLHRKKKKKLPKVFSPNALPDANRWLPKVARNQLKDEPSGFQGASNVAGPGKGSTGSAKITKAPFPDDLSKTGKSGMSKEELTAKLIEAAKKKGKKRK